MSGAFAAARRVQRSLHVVQAFEALADEVVAAVVGGRNPGYDPNNDALGRVGPGTRWKWLGNYYTPEALAHDRAVRSNLARGDSRFVAQLEGLPKLPAAIGSYFRARFAPGPDDMHLPG